MRCAVSTCDRPATRIVALSSSVVQLAREFCDEHAAKMCAETPVAGATHGAGIREPLFGTDLGPIESN